MKILLTGGTGYIGSHIAVELIDAGYEVEILDNLFNSKITVLNNIEQITGKKPRFHEVDLTNKKAVEGVFANNKYDAVMHLAGMKAVGESVEKPLEYYENNVGGTVNLLEAMKKYGLKKMIFSSSATVYGDAGVTEYVETMPTGFGISSPYGKTKFMIEEILKDLSVADPEFEIVILRYFNPIGAHPSGLIGEDPNGIPNNLMPIIMKVALGEIPKLKIYGNDYDTSDGTARRDYIHVVDLAKGHLVAIRALASGTKIYNLGSGKTVSVLEMVKMFEDVSHKALPYELAERRAGDLPEFYANCDRAKKELGWETELTVMDAMRDTLNYLEKR